MAIPHIHKWRHMTDAERIAAYASMKPSERREITAYVTRHGGIAKSRPTRHTSRPARDYTPMDIDAIGGALAKRTGIKAADLSRILRTYGRKAPPGEYPDAVQTIAQGILRENPASGALANVIARTTIADYWDKWRERKHHSIENILESQNGNETEENAENRRLREAFVAGLEYDLQPESHLDALAVIALLPKRIRAIAQARLDGQRVSNSDRQYLHRWLKGKGSSTVYRILTAA